MVQLPKNISCLFLGGAICEQPLEVKSSISLFEDN